MGLDSILIEQLDAVVALANRGGMTMPPGSRDVRLLATATFVNALGSGLYLPLSLILLGALSGLPLTTVGIVLTAAMACSLALMPLGGSLVDRFGARAVLIAAMAAQAAAFGGYPVVHGVIPFSLLALAAALGGQVVKAAQPVLVAVLAVGPHRARLLAMTRSLSNAGLGLGGLALACLPMGAGREWWVAASWANAMSFVATIGIYLRLPTTRRVGDAIRPVRILDRGVWRDERFRTYLLANTCSSFGYAALSNLVPLLAIVSLDLPPALAGGLFTLNTIVTAIAGVPAVRILQRRGIGDTVAAIGGATAMAAGLASFAVAAATPGMIWRSVVLVVGMAVYSLGECVHSPTSTALALEASPTAARGTYQGVYQMSWGVGAAAAPAVFTWLVHVGTLPAVAVPVLMSLACAVLLSRARAAVGAAAGSSRVKAMASTGDTAKSA